MIKVYTLFFLLIFSIVAKSEVLADGDSAINPLDTISISLFKEDLKIPQQIVDLLLDIEKMLNNQILISDLEHFKLNEIDVSIVMPDMEESIVENDLVREKVAQDFLDLSQSSYDKLVSYKSKSNKIHVYQYIGNTPTKKNDSQVDYPNTNQQGIISQNTDNYYAPERILLKMVFFMDKDYVANKQLLIMNVNHKLKLLKLF